MSLSHLLLFNVPPLLLCFLMLAVAAGLSIGGTLIFHRFISYRSLRDHNDIAGPIFNTLGVVYAVLLGFMVVVVWQGFDRAKLNVEMEMNCLSNLYMDSAVFEPEFGGKVRSEITAYARDVIGELDLLAKGNDSDKALETIQRLISLYGEHQCKNENEKIFLEEAVDKVNELLNLRMHRLNAAGTGIHSLLWFILVVGGMLTIIFTIFFGTENLNAKIIMSTLLAMLIALVLFTIMEFSLPFVGSARVACEPFKLMVERMEQGASKF